MNFSVAYTELRKTDLNIGEKKASEIKLISLTLVDDLVWGYGLASCVEPLCRILQNEVMLFKLRVRGKRIGFLLLG
jgi:hypothetical protein